MTGREEENLKIEKTIQRRVKDAPVVLKKYMTSISRLTPASRKVYLGYLFDFFYFLKEKYDIDGNSFDDFQRIKKMDIENYIEYTKINPKTGKENGISIRNSRLAAVMSLFDFLIDNEFITKNPCISIRKLKDNREKKVTYLTKEEIEDIKVNITTTSRSIYHEDPWAKRDYAIFILGCSTGLRNSAIREINVEDLDLKNKEVRVFEKDSVVKTVCLSTQTCAAIEEWLNIRQILLNKKQKESNAVFISNQMNRITSTGLQDILKKYTKGIKKHISPHKMRSTCAMNLYEKTGDIYLVSEVLGHKDVRNTQIYAKATKEKLRQAADIMDEIYN